MVGVFTGQTGYDLSDPLTELASLARTAGATVVQSVIQKRRRIDPAYYIGRGKAEQIAELAREVEANVIIFDNDLSPAQIRDLEEILELKVVDRSELILDIFATRAQTRQARLQVELAQLEYTAPRLRGMWTHLERTAGAGGGTGAGAVGGIGTRGPGERQIEIDRRIVSKRISALKRELAAIDRRKRREVEARKDCFLICLVGYTNAGKSTLMNAITGAGTLVRDKLFATLDTKTRRWNLPSSVPVLLSDTVGFVRRLPHHLIESFKATLEEALNADLLLHVVDASSDDAIEQVDAVDGVLDELEVGDTDMLVMLNKMDRPTDAASLHILKNRCPDAIEVSAMTGRGLDLLESAVQDRLATRQVNLRVVADSGNGKLISFLDRYGVVHSRDYEGSRVTMVVSIPPRHADRLVDLGAGVEYETI